MNIDEQLKEILTNAAPRVEPNPQAWARISQGRGRPRFLMPATAAAAIVVVIATAAILTGGDSERRQPAVPAPSFTAEPTSVASPEVSPAPAVAGSVAPVPTPPYLVAIVKASGREAVALVAPATGAVVRELATAKLIDNVYGGLRSPTLSHDGKHVFYREAHGHCQSWLMKVPITGGTPEHVLPPDVAIEAFAVADDGRIAALREAGCGTAHPRVLVEYSAEGHELRKLVTSDTANATTRELVWRPGVDELAVLLAVTDDEFRVDIISVTDAAGTGSRASVGALPNCGESAPSITGVSDVAFLERKLYIAAICPKAGPVDATRAALFVVDLDDPSHTPKLVAEHDDAAFVSGLFVDPSAKQVIYAVSDAGAAPPALNTYIYRLALGDDTPKKLATLDGTMIFGAGRVSADPISAKN